MITWIRENAGLATLLGSLVIVISTVAVGWHQLSELVAQQPEVQRHIYDTPHHVDPETQKQLEIRIDDLERRVRELESQRWQRYIDRQRDQNDSRRTRREK